MKVYIVHFLSEDEEATILGVYNSKAAAKQHITAVSDPEWDSGKYVVVEQEVKAAYVPA